MATTFIGTTAWSRMPGDREEHGDDGAITITRMYNGANTGGTGTGLAASWAAFKAAFPIGTEDHDIAGAYSVSLPTVVQDKHDWKIASIVYKGGNFEAGQETTEPHVAKRKVQQIIHVKHPDNADVEVELTYMAWRTIITYRKKSEPSKAGEFSAKADTTSVITDGSTVNREILQSKVEGEAVLTSAQILTATDNQLWLEDIEMDKQTDTGTGNTIWEATEYWIQGLTVA